MSLVTNLVSTLSTAGTPVPREPPAGNNQQSHLCSSLLRGTAHGGDTLSTDAMMEEGILSSYSLSGQIVSPIGGGASSFQITVVKGFHAPLLHSVEISATWVIDTRHGLDL